MKKLYGTGVAVITPFTETLEIDYKALKKLLRHTAKGVDYYVVMGTTGEAATCSEEEKKKVLEFVKANNANKLPIVFGIGGNNTQHVLDSIKSTDFDGVTALLSVSCWRKPISTIEAANRRLLWLRSVRPRWCWPKAAPARSSKSAYAVGAATWKWWPGSRKFASNERRWRTMESGTGQGPIAPTNKLSVTTG